MRPLKRVRERSRDGLPIEPPGDGTFTVVNTKYSRRRQAKQANQRQQQPPTQPQNKRQRTTVTTQQQQKGGEQNTNASRLIDDTIDFVISQGRHDSDPLIDIDDVSESSIDLYTRVEDIQHQIYSMQQQLNCLMSLAGLSKNSTDIHNSSTSIDQSHVSAPEQSQTQYTLSSYANAVKKSLPLQGTIRQAVLSVVYSDFRAKQNRSCNVVITGLESDSDLDDELLFCSFCDNEFGITPTVLRHKRLGPERNDRPRPLLVVLTTRDQANELLSLAKQLRKSKNLYTRQRVYINPDLTRAEARVAYEERCRRRASNSDPQATPTAPRVPPAAAAAAGATTRPRDIMNGSLFGRPSDVAAAAEPRTTTATPTTAAEAPAAATVTTTTATDSQNAPEPTDTLRCATSALSCGAAAAGVSLAADSNITVIADVHRSFDVTVSTDKGDIAADNSAIAIKSSTSRTVTQSTSANVSTSLSTPANQPTTQPST